MRHLFALPAAILLLACQKPSTMVPHVSSEELRAEQQVQQSLAEQQANNNGQPASNLNMNAMMDRVAQVAKRITPAITSMCKDLYSDKQECNYKIAIAKDKSGLNAYADGKNIVIFPEMIAFARTDEELAMVLTHEAAHNMMRHVQSTQQNVALGGLAGLAIDVLAASQGYNTQGAASKFATQGALLRYSPGFEKEADYVGLYVMARAGYPIGEAPSFWRRMSVKNPDSIYVGTTHPTNPNRYVILQKTIEEIQTKQHSNTPLIPEFRSS